MRWHDRVARKIPARMVLAFARRYIAGPSLGDALRVADDLWTARRIRSTLDVLGEQVTSPEQAGAALEAYLRAADGLAARPHVSLSFKPGHFGQLVEPALCERQARALAARCALHGTRLTIDMEDTDLTDATLDLYHRLRPELPALGLVLQSRLFRTAEDVEDLAGLDARVRLCIGAYDVAGDAGYGTRREAKENLLRLLPRLLDVAAVVELATHDRALVERVREVLAQRQVPRERIEFQMLLGVPRRRLQDELVADGWTVRLYVPYAESWDDATAYLRRRLVETPSIAGLALRNLFGPG
ncbi:MAG: proline dehydrogenase family protein [Deltaproteobacteria bacterium]|nr:proline dehydrogenase family protein [Deltaproteobacteria bacterium]